MRVLTEKDKKAYARAHRKRTAIKMIPIILSVIAFVIVVSSFIVFSTFKNQRIWGVIGYFNSIEYPKESLEYTAEEINNFKIKKVFPGGLEETGLCECILQKENKNGDKKEVGKIYFLKGQPYMYIEEQIYSFE